MTTMSDVARAAGVSVMTVSNVVNGRPRVGAETRLRVLDVIAELGYEVNLNARRLRAGRTDTVALIVPGFEHMYFADLAARVARSLEQTGRHLVVERGGASREGELAALSLARLRMYDGVLLSVVGLERSDIDRLRAATPIVLLGERDLPKRYDHVAMDNVEGARLATAHMLSTGSRDVVILGGSAQAATGEGGMAPTRTVGWRAAHDEAGRAADPRLVVELTHPGTAEARRAVADLVASGTVFDGIFAVTDAVAVGALAGLADAGLRVPDDVQLVGFDNLAVSEFLVPALTTVDPGHDVMVREALRLLDRRIAADGGPVIAERIVGPVRLVHRGTTRR
ncbi:LacI family DNA-binding transcriptional regulator [Sanguibacter sp. 25GB23B1]|uniref:LacI family DNA-binding transcriptional regulator n=1 Tax=unclassified Sanguibacter TaxID=2645534 RepID=UPI0032AF101B